MHGASANDTMHVEMQVALNFIISYLYNKLPRTRIHLYGEELEKLLRVKFHGHWYPSNPVKGSAYRCVHLNSAEIDPCFELAAVRSGLDFVNDIKSNLPSELSVWVDPREVSYAIGGPDGKPGPVNVLYRHQSGPEDEPENKQSQEISAANDLSSNNSFMTFNPHAKDFLPKAPSNLQNDAPYHGEVPGMAHHGQMVPEVVQLNYGLRPARRLYTVDEFASTKFGSTKMKSNARNLTTFQRMPGQPQQGYVNTSPTLPNIPSTQGINFTSDVPTSPMDPTMLPPFYTQGRPSSLATSSSFSESSSGSSTSSSPDHVKAQMMKNGGRNSVLPSSPTSPWGDSFTLPVSTYKAADSWPMEHQDFPSPHDDFLTFTGMRDFNPFPAELSSMSVPSSSHRIMSMT